ncbi:MAG: hypothetical protein HC804_01495 [Anaerolineae bacterium]|nr:hypothetical protein [Anaerolineae bacterium]
MDFFLRQRGLFRPDVADLTVPHRSHIRLPVTSLFSVRFGSNGWKADKRMGHG